MVDSVKVEKWAFICRQNCKVSMRSAAGMNTEERACHKGFHEIGTAATTDSGNVDSNWTLSLTL